MFQRPKYPSPSFFICAALLAFALAGCASKPREGPPAPVVNVTPRQPAVIEQSPEPKETVESAAKPKPAVPAKQPTTTYAYREPGTEPPPAPASAPCSGTGTRCTGRGGGEAPCRQARAGPDPGAQAGEPRSQACGATGRGRQAGPAEHPREARGAGGRGDPGTAGCAAPSPTGHPTGRATGRRGDAPGGRTASTAATAVSRVTGRR